MGLCDWSLEKGLPISVVSMSWRQVGPASLLQTAQSVGQARLEHISARTSLPQVCKDLESPWGGGHQKEGEKRYNLLRLNPEATEVIPEKHWLKLAETELCSLRSWRLLFLLSGLKSKMRFFVENNYHVLHI